MNIINRFKAKLADIKVNIKSNIHKKLNKITQIKASKVADLLTFISLFIIFWTTYNLIWWLGMYVLAIILLICSYFMARR